MSSDVIKCLSIKVFPLRCMAELGLKLFVLLYHIIIMLNRNAFGKCVVFN